MRIRAISRLPFGPSNKHSSTLVAFCEKSEKLTPVPSHVAPSGYGCPSHTFIESSSTVHPSTSSGRTGGVFKTRRDFPFMLSLSKHEPHLFSISLSRVKHVNSRGFELTPLKSGVCWRRSSGEISCTWLVPWKSWAIPPKKHDCGRCLSLLSRRIAFSFL